MALDSTGAEVSSAFTAGANVVVPEPSGLSLLALGLGVLGRRRRFVEN